MTAPDSFPYKTPPFDHQREVLRRSARRTAFMLAMEQGTGKSKVIADNAAYLYLNGSIGGLLVVAPMGADKNWLTDELPAHMSEALTWDGVLWRSSRADTAAFQRRWTSMLADRGILPVLLMNIEALTTDAGYAAAVRFLKSRPVMMVVDESNIIASPSAAQARAARRLGRLAAYRRTLDGTPGTESPFHLYGQYNFLDPRILGFRTFAEFKNRYGVWRQVYFRGQDHLPEAERKGFPSLEEYRNLEELAAKIAPHTFRVLKDVLRLPPKVYRKRYVPLSAEQRKAYQALKKEYMVDVDDRWLDGSLAIVRNTRLHQIACGFLPAVGEEPEALIRGPQPRFDATLEEYGLYPVKTLVWARFRMEREILAARFAAAGVPVARYDGETQETRDLAKETFQKDTDELKVLICSEAASRSFTLTRARHNIYHSNFQRVLHRIQSEDRSHRAGLQHSQLYTDIVAEGTRDEDILASYREKKATADIVHRDPSKEWI